MAYKKNITRIAAVLASLLLVFNFTGCKKNNTVGDPKATSPAAQSPQASATAVKSPSPTAMQIDLNKVKPNEAGRVMVVMFHNFVQSFTPSKYDKGEYTTTFDAFKNLLSELYGKGYRLISINDYLTNNINVAPGCIPMVFTFDDGSKGQLSLVEEGGKLKASKDSAVGIMEEFNQKHPDFGLKGTFYVNLGNETFPGKGTLSDSLKYLIDEGFDIGNHTYEHVHLNEIKSAAEIQKQIGLNQKKMQELVPGYEMKTFSLPYGQPSKELKSFVIKGSYQGTDYQNAAIMEVGWDPYLTPVSKKFDPTSIHRVRASGMIPVDADLAWWLKQLSRNEQYVSDGNPDTVTVVKSIAGKIDMGKMQGKKLITY